MSVQDISARVEGNDRSVTVHYDFGNDLLDAAEKFGEDVVFTRYIAAAKIDLQSLLRRGISAGKADDEIAGMVAAWKPGTRTVVGKSDMERARDALGKMSPEEKAALLAELGLA